MMTSCVDETGHFDGQLAQSSVLFSVVRAASPDLVNARLTRAGIENCKVQIAN